MKIRRLKIQQYGRLFFWVRSRSRKGLRHLVDLEDFDKWPCVCTCEAWKFNVCRPVCGHVIACVHYILEPFNLEPEEEEAVKEACVFGLQMGNPLVESIYSCLVYLERLFPIRFDPIEPEPKPILTPPTKKRQYILEEKIYA